MNQWEALQSEAEKLSRQIKLMGLRPKRPRAAYLDGAAPQTPGKR